MEKVKLPRLLIVEDDNNFSVYLRDLLENLGYIVADIVTSGEDAVQRVPILHPDLVLMDILLAGDMDGVAAAEQIRVQYHVPVVFVSAYADPMILQRARFTRPYGFVAKPFEKKQLYAAIEIALHNHKTERQRSEQTSWSISALQSMADGVLVTDELGKIQFMNRSAEDLTGWNLRDAQGEEWHMIFRTYRHIPGSIADASIVTESLTPALGQYANLLRKDDTVLTIDYSMGPLHAGETGAAQVIVFRNATERNLLEQALADSRKRYKDLVNSVEGIVWEAEGETHQFLFVSKQAQNILGYPAEDWTNQSGFWKEHLHPDDREWVTRFVQNVTANQDYQIEYRMMAKSGEPVWIRDMFHAEFDPEHPSRFRGVLLNITEGKKAEQSLKLAHDELERRVYERTAELRRAIGALTESEERYSLAVLGANDGLWDWNLQSGEIFYTSRWKSMLGWSDPEIGTKPAEWLTRIHPEDIERVKAEINGHLEAKSPQFQSEFRMLHKDGTYRWMLTRGVALRDERKGTYRMAGSQTDITERKIAEEQLLHDAFYDALTNLPNRALFLDRLATAAARSKAHSERGKIDCFAVLFLDLDRFKVINDSLGHVLGDQLLIGIAKRLQQCLRPGDTVARLGGDEFTILVEDITDVREAIKVAERVQLVLQLPFNLDGRDVFTSVSIGIALSSTEYERDVDLLRDADTAMFRAKEKGKSRYEVFDKSMHGRALELLQLEMDLRRAVERKEFRVHYQPVVSLQDGKIIGFEALVRWMHPERGLLPPEQIIPLAEETGLIIPIGYIVLQDACRQMRSWHQEFGNDLFLSVNISAKQFSQKDLLDQLQSILASTNFDPRYLKFEITESIIMEDIELAASLLQKLKKLQVRLLIDDFGTGYSSLSYLHKFPIDTLKVDRAFVSSGTDGENWEIVRTIISLARNLGMDVIAEGVETESQRNYLLSLGCEKGQGFLFSRPMDSASVTAVLTSKL